MLCLVWDHKTRTDLKKTEVMAGNWNEAPLSCSSFAHSGLFCSVFPEHRRGRVMNSVTVISAAERKVWGRCRDEAPKHTHHFPVVRMKEKMIQGHQNILM